MIFRNLKFLVRSIRSKKLYFILNLAGLTAGITAFVLIALWINTEISYDKFQYNTERTYRVEYKLYEEEILETYSAAAVPVIGPIMKNMYPEVEEYTRFKRLVAVAKNEDRYFKEQNMFYAESSFFTLFNFPLAIGQITSEILAVNKAVITESAAKRYFGNENPVGKSITINGKTKYFVSAVAKDLPSKSHLKFDILLSYENLINEVPYFNDGWFGEKFYTYVKLTPEADYKKVEAKIPGIVEEHLGDFMKQALFLAEFKLKPILDIHLYSNLQNELEVNGNAKTVSYMGIIAFLVLIIAFVNYINLSTSNSLDRSTEVGVRKVLGALKNHLFGQFISESFFVNAFALLLSLGLIFITLPAFRGLTGSPIEIPWLIFPVGILLLYFCSSIITGIIPAAFLAKITPSLVLKGKRGTLSLGMIRFRNGLIVFQFAISVILIVCTIFIGKQISFLQKQNLGLNIDQMLVVEGPKSTDNTFSSQNDAFRSELIKNSFIKQMSVATNVPGEEVTYQPVYGKLIKGVNTEKKIRMIGIDSHFKQTYELHLLAGRNFDKNFQEKINEVIINKEAVKYLGFESAEQAIGQHLSGGQNGEATIIGVFNNYHQKSLREVPCPLMFSNRPFNNYYSIKIDDDKASEVISMIENTWNAQYPGNPLNYFFLDEYFNNQYRSDIKFGNLFMLFSVLAIFIACLGLLGLSSYSTSQRSKEIGVHKVNGAKIYEVLLLLNKDFLKWVAIAIVIATPVAWFTMNKWLENFAYKTTLSWWIFALAGVLALGIALLTVSWQSWRAATRNPVEALRYE